MNVLVDFFVKRHGIKVLMTTHSPSTVAVAPEGSVHVLERNFTVTTLNRVEIDAGLRLLTVGIPSLSILHENRRQVFVESPNDEHYYESIYKLLLRNPSYGLEPEVSLTFIASGESRTDKNGVKINNCAQVENIVTLLRNRGNKQVWGIIDYDNGNNPGCKEVVLLGTGNRYNIESYVFDPLLVAALLLQQKLIQKSDLGMTENESYVDLRTFGNERLQFIANYILGRIKHRVKTPHDEATRKAMYLNGSEINLPIWFSAFPGHDLEKIIVDEWNGLNSIKKNDERALKMHVLNNILDDIPGLLSRDFADVMINIQNGSL